MILLIKSWLSFDMFDVINNMYWIHTLVLNAMKTLNGKSCHLAMVLERILQHMQFQIQIIQYCHF